MGERGADPTEHPDDGELDQMAKLLEQGLDAGAVGVSTSRTERHRTSTGDNLGTLRAREPELLALASVLRGAGQRRLPVPVGQLPHHRRRVRPVRVRAGHRIRPGQPATGQLHGATGHRLPPSAGAT